MLVIINFGPPLIESVSMRKNCLGCCVTNMLQEPELRAHMVYVQ